MDKLEKGPKEIFSPEIQKVSVTLSRGLFFFFFYKTPLHFWNPCSQDLLLLEEQEGSVNFKFGVLFTRPGQLTDDEMLSNG